MKIVRTVGQAFEVCHKYAASAMTASPLSGQQRDADDEVAEDDELGDEEDEVDEGESRDTIDQHVDHLTVPLEKSISRSGIIV